MFDVPELILGTPSCQEIKIFPDEILDDSVVRSVLDLFERQRDESLAVKRDLQKTAENILVLHGQCDTFNKNVAEEFALRTGKFSGERILRELLGPKSGWQSLHKNISCLVSSFVTPSTQVKVPEKVHSSLDNVQRIGEDSVEGYALKASYSDADLFVVKTAKNFLNDSLPHEAVFGLYLGNQLKAFLPNLVYVYGYTKCSPTLVGLTPRTRGAVRSWCGDEGSDVSYLFMENILGGVTLRSWCGDASLDDFIDVVLQVLNALSLAHTYCGLVHNDLHTGNIMIRDFGSPENAPPVPVYQFDSLRRIGTLRTRFVAYLIDFGISQFKLLGNTFHSSQPGLKTAFFDIYKFLRALVFAFLETRTFDLERKLSFLDTLFLQLRLPGHDKTATELYKAVSRKKTTFHVLPPETHFSMTFAPLQTKELFKHVTDDLRQKQEEVLSCDFYLRTSEPREIKSATDFNVIYDGLGDREDLKQILNVNFNALFHFKQQLAYYSQELDATLPLLQLRDPGNSVEAIQAFIEHYAVLKNLVFEVRTAAKSSELALLRQSTLNTNNQKALTDLVRKAEQSLVTPSQILGRIKNYLGKATTKPEQKLFGTIYGL